jgi:hypothetical protein
MRALDGGADPRKVALGKLVRERRVAACGWLAARLKIRSAADVERQKGSAYI